MGDADYLFGTLFTWLKHKDRNTSVHICQSAFTEYSSLVIGSHCQQGPQYDTRSFRVPHWIHSPRWLTQSQSSTSKIGLSDYFWLHQLTGNLHSTQHCPCTHLSCLVHKCSPPTTLQGRSPCSKIPNEHELISHILSFTVIVYNQGIQPLTPLSW